MAATATTTDPVLGINPVECQSGIVEKYNPKRREGYIRSSSEVSYVPPYVKIAGPSMLFDGEDVEFVAQNFGRDMPTVVAVVPQQESFRRLLLGNVAELFDSFRDSGHLTYDGDREVTFRRYALDSPQDTLSVGEPVLFFLEHYPKQDMIIRWVKYMISAEKAALLFPELAVAPSAAVPDAVAVPAPAQPLA